MKKKFCVFIPALFMCLLFYAGCSGIYPGHYVTSGTSSSSSSSSGSRSKIPPLGTYLVQGKKVVITKDTFTVKNSSDDSVLMKFSCRMSGDDILLKLQEIHDDSGTVHTCSSDTSELKEKIAQVKELAVPESLDALDLVVGYGRSSNIGYDFSSYSDEVAKKLEAKITSYLSDLQKIITGYISKKYNSYARFICETDDSGNITLTQNFSDAMSPLSFFYSSSAELNDFEKNVPFLIEDGTGASYIGTPSKSGDNFSAFMLKYYDMGESVQRIVSYYEDEIQASILDNASDLITEGIYYTETLNRTGKKTSIPVAVRTIETALPKEKVSARISVSAAPAVTLSGASCASPALSNDSVSMTGVKSILDFNGAQLVKQSS